MENLAHFIHEEIYLVGSPVPSNEPTIPTKTFQLAVIADVTNKEDEQLLFDILKAIKIDRSDVVMSSEVSESCRLWLIFAESFTQDGMVLHPTKKLEIKAKTLILANPLKVLRDSKQQKAALWLILKEEFGL